MNLKLEEVREITVSELLNRLEKLTKENQQVIKENTELIYELECCTAEIERFENPTVH